MTCWYHSPRSSSFATSIPIRAAPSICHNVNGPTAQDATRPNTDLLLLLLRLLRSGFGSPILLALLSLRYGKILKLAVGCVGHDGGRVRRRLLSVVCSGGVRIRDSVRNVATSISETHKPKRKQKRLVA